MTISQNNSTKRPRRRRTWTVQYIRHSPGAVNMHAHLLGRMKEVQSYSPGGAIYYSHLLAVNFVIFSLRATILINLNLNLNLAYVFFGPPNSYPTVISIGSAVFAPVTQCRESLYFPLKIAP